MVIMELLPLLEWDECVPISSLVYRIKIIGLQADVVLENFCRIRRWIPTHCHV